MKYFYGLEKKDLHEWLQSRNYPAYRATQIFDWVYEKGVVNFQEMTTLGKSLRDELQETFSLASLTQEKEVDSDDMETTKFLWKLSDKSFVESVLIRSGDRRTLCISSQVGCPARCAFCASGKEGLLRNLETAEIVEQVMSVQKYLSFEGEKITNIVFMGMGEPLENYEAVTSTIRILIDLVGLSQRKITVSTVGVIEGIERLEKEDFKVSLVLSLHAANQKLRKKIIPYARKYLLEDILEAIKKYSKETKRDVTYEYILIKDINDSKQDAIELAKLLRKEQCTVNLIPYNPVQGLNLSRPSSDVIESFRATLVGLGIRTTWRYTKGKDIAAACGQLALIKE